MGLEPGLSHRTQAWVLWDSVLFEKKNSLSILVGHRPVSYKVDKAHLAGQEGILLAGEVVQPCLVNLLSTGKGNPSDGRGTLSRGKLSFRYTRQYKTKRGPKRSPNLIAEFSASAPALPTLWWRLLPSISVLSEGEGVRLVVEAECEVQKAGYDVFSKSEAYARVSNESGHCRIALSTRREYSWSTRLYNLADQSLLCRRGCTTSPTRRIPSWSTVQPCRPRRESSWSRRLYSLSDQSLLAGDNLAGQEDSLLGRRGCTVDQEGILLVGEVVQPRRPGGSPPRRPGGFPPGPARLYPRPGGNPPVRRGCTTLPTRRISS
ncbi:hypothetical protein PGTUg99_028957 [Puccinia graminis f. sp. tritici]|uniref:Uncharacterized protein n=1 Tax=Puccinia graminis f. sp. tritici TaxID=56615 RepID=A0A5B0QR78_PUCGR|nr:hypothetical protein PGTUg99_028957 [Puccinia graminis f. sp. tritici]